MRLQGYLGSLRRVLAPRTAYGSPMRESTLLLQIAQASAAGFLGRPDVLVGPGDDCAVIAAPGGSTLLLTTDQFIEGVHYARGRSTESIAASAIARSISDIAAMGGAPLYALATAALTKDTHQQHATDLFEAMAACAQGWNCPLIGGDIAITDGQTILTVTAIGAPHATRGPVLRNGAKPGDRVYVTGPLGAALASNWTRTPEPRLDTARRLCEALGDNLHAMIDISDGLGRDAGRIAERSGIAIALEADSIPLAKGIASWREAIAAGEDYELCFTSSTAPPDELGCIAVGIVVEGEGCRAITPDGESFDAHESGWDHRA